MTRILRAIGIALFFAAPTLASAAGSASIGAFYPSTPDGTVGIGTPVAFSMVISGFNNPRYWLVDSFAGGATTVNLDSQGNFYWTPNRDDIGIHTITVTVSDSYGTSANASKTFTVTRPSVSAGSVTPGNAVRFGTTLTFALTSSGLAAPAYDVSDGFFNSSVRPYNTTPGGVFSWTPTFQDIGVHTLLITAKDAHGYATTTATITVEGLPGVSIAGLSPGNYVAAGSTLTFTATTTGFASPVISVRDLFYSGTATSTLTIDSSGRAAWTPVYNDLGVHTLVVSAADGAGHSASTQISVTVGPPNASTQSSPAYATQATTQPAVAASAPAAANSSSATQARVFVSFLSVGSSGPEVTALQQKLAKLGFLAVSPTGYFGPITKRALQAFQKSIGLEQVGFVGPGTRAALNK